VVPRVIRPLDELLFLFYEGDVIMLDKKYNHLDVEKNRYENWKNNF